MLSRPRRRARLKWQGHDGVQIVVNRRPNEMPSRVIYQSRRENRPRLCPGGETVSRIIARLWGRHFSSPGYFERVLRASFDPPRVPAAVKWVGLFIKWNSVARRKNVSREKREVPAKECLCRENVSHDRRPLLGDKSLYLVYAGSGRLDGTARSSLITFFNLFGCETTVQCTRTPLRRAFYRHAPLRGLFRVPFRGILEKTVPNLRS